MGRSLKDLYVDEHLMKKLKLKLTTKKEKSHQNLVTSFNEPQVSVVYNRSLWRTSTHCLLHQEDGESQAWVNLRQLVLTRVTLQTTKKTPKIKERETLKRRTKNEPRLAAAL